VPSLAGPETTDRVTGSLELELAVNVTGDVFISFVAGGAKVMDCVAFDTVKERSTGAAELYFVSPA
jgi:hypothetical protein